MKIEVRESKPMTHEEWEAERAAWGDQWSDVLALYGLEDNFWLDSAGTSAVPSSVVPRGEAFANPHQS